MPSDYDMVVMTTGAGASARRETKDRQKASPTWAGVGASGGAWLRSRISRCLHQRPNLSDEDGTTCCLCVCSRGGGQNNVPEEGGREGSGLALSPSCLKGTVHCIHTAGAMLSWRTSNIESSSDTNHNRKHIFIYHIYTINLFCCDSPEKNIKILS